MPGRIAAVLGRGMALIARLWRADGLLPAVGGLCVAAAVGEVSKSIPTLCFRLGFFLLSHLHSIEFTPSEKVMCGMSICAESAKLSMFTRGSRKIDVSVPPPYIV